MLVELGTQEDIRLKGRCFGEARVVVDDEERPRRKMQAGAFTPIPKGLSVNLQSLRKLTTPPNIPLSTPPDARIFARIPSYHPPLPISNFTMGGVDRAGTINGQ